MLNNNITVIFQLFQFIILPPIKALRFDSETFRRLKYYFSILTIILLT